MREGYQNDRDSRLKIQGAASRGLIKIMGEDDDDRIEQAIGHQVMTKQAAGTDYDFPLNRWNVAQAGTSKVVFSIGIDADANLNTLSKLNAYAPIKAFLSYMEGKRSSGDALGTDILAATTFEDRDFNIRQDPSHTMDLVLTYVSTTHQRPDDDAYTYVSIEFTVETPSQAIDYEKLSQLILGETGSISTTDLMIPRGVLTCRLGRQN